MAYYEVEGLTFLVIIKHGHIHADCKELDVAFTAESSSLHNITRRDIMTIDFIYNYTALLIEFYTKNHEETSIKLCSVTKYTAYREMKYIQNAFNGLDPYEQIYTKNTNMQDLQHIYKRMLIKDKAQQTKIINYIREKRNGSITLYQVMQERDALLAEKEQLESQVAELASKLAEMAS